MAIENKLNKFSGKDDDEHRYACPGRYTVDLKLMRAYLTEEPDNQEEHFDVERASVQKRDTRSDADVRYAMNIAANSLKEGNKNEFNYLGTKFREKSNYE